MNTHASRHLTGTRARAALIVAAVAAAILSAACGTGGELTPEASATLAEVRGHVMALDPRSGLRAAAAFADADAFPELRAWRLVALARADEATEAEALARQMIADDAQTPWGWFALSASLIEQRDRGKEALEASRRALELAPDDADVLWMHAQALIAAEQYAQAGEFVDAHADALDNPGPLLHQKSRALYYRSFQEQDVELREQALQLAAEARTADPEFAAAWQAEGAMLQSLRRTEESLAPYAQAAALSPGSTAIVEQLARTIGAAESLSAEQKRERVEARVDALLAVHPDDPAALRAAARAWEAIGEAERKAALDAEILDRYPGSLAAEWLAVEEYREVGQRVWAARRAEEEPDAEVVEEYARLLREFIARPRHNLEVLKGDAFRNLFQLHADRAAELDPDDLLWIVEGMVEFEGINPHIAYAQGAQALARHPELRDAAERVAREGIEAGREKIESQRSRYDTDGEYEQAQQWMAGLMYDALGWVLFESERYEEAEAELLRAYNENPKNRENLHHLGQLYEHLGRVEEAERYYVQGLAAQAPGDNPNRAALEELYRTRTGGDAGFEEYLAEIEARESDTRYAEIMGERLDPPKEVPAFDLDTLAGATLSSSDLQGRVTVINFWGIWCGWCVIEMPEVQRLHERYADDPDVQIWTLNNDRNRDEVQPWMDENGYSFEVLFDDGYVDTSAGIFTFPTTWFIGPDGTMAFEKEGWSQELFEEFSWRIEALRDGAGGR